ncbi:hypothetical protein [Nocardia sp. NBC_01009]|uniref:hypothetical protein n=1 Tax=Nocardia sp. NBC_01009 TaxID=2975996 RepID=UPI00386B7A8F|nr:hypothetical protein OHA42_31850 [Nocardia sp. NBC_01009]
MIVHQLDQNEWTVVRAVRLAALIESPPGTFGSTFEVAYGFTRTGNRKQCIDWPEQFEIEMSLALEP